MASNPPSNTDTISQTRWKTEMVDWLDSFRFTYAITLSWNRSVGMDRARADLRNLMNRVDRRLISSTFHKVPSQFRTTAAFFFEGVKHDHVHVHSLWKAPPGKCIDLGKMFPRQRGGVWNDVVASGSYDIEACNLVGRNAEVLGYILKQQHRLSEETHMVWADEFHPAH